MALVTDERDNHGVEVEEEHEQVEAELDEALLLVHVELAEDLGGVEQVLVLDDSGGRGQQCNKSSALALLIPTHFLAFHATNGRFSSSGSQ